MKTKYEMDDTVASAFIAYAKTLPTTSKVFPTHFYQVMELHTGIVNPFSTAFGRDETGRAYRNPLVVVLGDSVTGGHFEVTEHTVNLRKLGQELDQSNRKIPFEITDVLTSYPERFRKKLIELYGATSVSIVNAGIGGDTIIGMRDRLERDVISLCPDLVIINATLNWYKELGDTDCFAENLRAVVSRIKADTSADVILLTPNMTASERIFAITGERDTLEERVEKIYEIAEAEEVCLADAYRVWKGFTAQGYDVVRMLSNGFNHPTPVGHEVFAIELMKLFPEQVRDSEWKNATRSCYA